MYNLVTGCKVTCFIRIVQIFLPFYFPIRPQFATRRPVPNGFHQREPALASTLPVLHENDDMPLTESQYATNRELTCH